MVCPFRRGLHIANCIITMHRCEWRNKSYVRIAVTVFLTISMWILRVWFFLGCWTAHRREYMRDQRSPHQLLRRKSTNTHKRKWNMWTVCQNGHWNMPQRPLRGYNLSEYSNLWASLRIYMSELNGISSVRLCNAIYYFIFIYVSVMHKMQLYYYGWWCSVGLSAKCPPHCISRAMAWIRPQES